MAVLELTKDNFEKTITDHDIVVVDFWAPWCGPCRGFAPVFEATAAKHPDIAFGKLNTDDEQEVAAHFNIRSIPTLMIFRGQILLFSQPGALPGSALEDLVGKVKALDMDKVRADVAKQSTQAA